MLIIIDCDLLYTPYILRVYFFANQDFKTLSRVVKFAIKEESNGRRNQYYSLICTCTVYCTTSIAYTSRIPGVAFMCRDQR